MRKIFLITIVLFTAYRCEWALIEGDPPDEPLENFQIFWESFDRHYPFFELKQIDWNSIRATYEVQIDRHTTPEQLHGIFEEIIPILKDGHVELYGYRGDRITFEYQSGFPSNEGRHTFQYIEQLRRVNQSVEYADLINSDLGYILIRSFGGPRSHFKVIDDILSQFQDKSGLVIDVRSNGGGSDQNSDLIAGRFADRERLYKLVKYRNGPEHDDFTDWYAYYIEGEGERYLKPVAVLTNRGTYSAAEDFVLAMRSFPQVTVVGSQTGGGSGNPIVRELPNGWSVRLSAWYAATPDEASYEGIGLIPDISVNISQQDSLDQRDTMLEEAMTLLN